MPAGTAIESQAIGGQLISELLLGLLNSGAIGGGGGSSNVQNRLNDIDNRLSRIEDKVQQLLDKSNGGNGDMSGNEPPINWPGGAAGFRKSVAAFAQAAAAIEPAVASPSATALQTDVLELQALELKAAKLRARNKIKAAQRRAEKLKESKG
jgi:hypothetical protein